MKRIVSLILALSMVLSLCASAFAYNFSDLTGDNAKYASAVEALTELKVIDGFPDETFRPDDYLTRAQVAKMLVICLGLGDQVESLSTKTVFSDVATNYWGAGYINAAAQSKIIVGYPDGTFKPENQVTYAEAFTMALRALGYGNVVEAEGTWPTAYMLKAVELELTDDMEGVSADKPATRGNTAILLWNMLRTPMWKIYEESQGNGMTMTARDDFMLNVKFPKYAYLEEVYLDDVTVDNGEKLEKKVKATLRDGDGDAYITAYIKEDIDISRLVPGTKVASLIKEYKDADKATFLTLTKEYEFVEGLVTDVSKINEGKIKIDNVEYKLDSRTAFDQALELAENDYVVVEVEGKRIVGYLGLAVIKVLPNEGKEVEKTSTLRSKIDEDALVIIDGKWATRDEIQEGDVYTELSEDNDTIRGDAYYMVARERKVGTFESLTYEKDDDERMYFEVDGDEYRTFYRMINGQVYEIKGDDKDEVEIETLTKKKADNKYLDEEVELVMNYLSQVVKAYFEDVDGNGTGNNFYAVMSNGVWTATDPDTGDNELRIRLANGDDEEGSVYKFAKKFTEKQFDGTEIENGVVFDNAEGDSGEVVFVWAKLNDKDEIKSIAVLNADLDADTAVDPFSYDDDYGFAEFSEEYDKTNAYITTADGKFKVTSGTVVFKLIPELDDEDDEVVGFKFEVAADPKAALSGVETGIVAYDTTNKINENRDKMVASHVFIMEDAISSELEAAKVEAVKERAGHIYLKIDGSWERVDEDNKKSIIEDYGDAQDLEDMFIVFSRTTSEDTVVRGVVHPTDLAGASIVQAVDGSIVQFIEGFLAGDIDLDKKDDAINKKYEDYQIVRINASVNKYDEVEFDDGESLGFGLPAGNYRRGDRAIEDPELEVIYLIRIDGVDEKDVIDAKAKVTYYEDIKEEEPEEEEPVVEPSGDEDVSGDEGERV